MLSIENLAAGYDRLEVLHDISIKVEEAGSVVVLGPNGAGKSTLCRAISGLLPCRHGKIVFDGKDMTGASPADRVRAGIVQVPEGRQVFPDMTVLENLRLGSWIHGEPKGPDLQKAFDLFPRLAERRNQNAGLMSGGEQQLLALARAMMARPSLLLLDEPTQGLSPVAIEQVATALISIRAQGVSILLVEQNLSLAEAVGERAYVLETGRCALEGPAAELLSSDAVAASYLGH
ncbi:ABC transporter ATP-binding protein [Neorhizobium alkalisoli]|jgi:branched-chain amino acid transport system ATP-binding protein|uniref:Amino acid/amide ABC transporter ATP-binding protein 2 (HAAT family) n=1 Tax=Neorhizobium alkalisoli TaxID=528178 RepID=A0A561Q7X7_9HYPH|nr:ABC transporter ATP-binding protein [Neorhizobium alkalisoli]TWF46486.1 amino acid/amide ABC transporter ATP-binding protein 2 (HAAT family) [Neorhizobium alkalisoli]